MVIRKDVGASHLLVVLTNQLVQVVILITRRISPVKNTRDVSHRIIRICQRIIAVFHCFNQRCRLVARQFFIAVFRLERRCGAQCLA